ncbi:MAG: hypothetical protein IKU53_00120 [Firmicutes bacterium]|nr:hypothetical protein [Bacillota bacterium]
MLNLEDRIGEFLVPHLKDFIFDELSESYLAKQGLTEIMSGVPIPLRKTELNNITTLSIALNMAFVIGCDPNFQYREKYIQYILKAFDKRFAQGLVADGVDGAQKNDFDYACIQFRAAMLIDPENIDALYCYGRACKDAYELGEDEDFIGRFKAESLEAFEKVTLKKPDFADAYYFLGYGYINLGLYVKAKLTWKEFIKLSNDEEKKKEIEERLALLVEPVKIEEGYNLVLSGRFAEGIERLSAYTDGEYKDWWPLWYYLGTAYQGLEIPEKAVENYLKVLQLSPSNLEAMEELVRMYEVLGDAEKVEKYTKKIGVIKGNMELDRLEKMKEKNINFS